MLCSKCNTQNQEGAKICLQCGTAFSAPPSPAPTPTPTQPLQPAPPKSWWKVWWKLVLFGISILIISLLSFWLVANILQKQKQPTQKPITQVSPTPTVVGEVKPTGLYDPKYEPLWQELLAKYGQDYDSCLVELTGGLAACQRPQELSSDLKENINVLILLDSSGSMGGLVSGEQKMAVAKEVISKFVDTVPQNAKVGLIIYGHKGSNSAADKAVSCQGIEEVYPLGALDKTAFSGSLARFSPTGWTPIAGALNLAKERLAGFDKTTTSNLIYLVSDGEETCGGDPVSAARSIKDAGLDLIVNVVGFDVGDVAKNQLTQIAQVTGGKYFDARTSSEMRKVFGDYEKFLADLQRYSLCLQAQRNKQWLTDTGKVNKSWLCLQGKKNKEWLDLYSEANKIQVENREGAQYLWAKIKERHDPLQVFIDAATKAGREQTQANIDALERALQEVQKQLQRTK